MVGPPIYLYNSYKETGAVSNSQRLFTFYNVIVISRSVR